MLFVIVFTVYRNMPNLTAIEVARAHLAAKDKEKQDAAEEKDKHDAGKRKGKADETGKKKGAPAKGNHRQPTENAETEMDVPAIAIPKESKEQPDSEQQVKRQFPYIIRRIRVS